MGLGDVQETATTLEIDEETYKETYKSMKWNILMPFVQGDGFVPVVLHQELAETKNLSCVEIRKNFLICPNCIVVSVM